MADTLKAVAGYDRAWTIPLLDRDGQPYPYALDATLSLATVRHDGATTLVLSVEPLVPGDGTIVLSGTGAQFASGGPGDYRVRVGVADDSGRTPLAYDATLAVLAPSTNHARLALESAIYGQSGPVLGKVGLEQVVGAETRALDLPIARSLSAMGLPPDSFAGVADADLARVPAYAQGQFHDLLEERVLGMVLSRWDGFDFTEGSESAQKLGALRDSIEKSLARVQKLNASRYTPGTIVPDPGSAPPVGDDGKLHVGRVNLNIYSRARCRGEEW